MVLAVFAIAGYFLMRYKRQREADMQAEIQQMSFGEHGGMETAFVPKITYEYEVEGRHYSSSRYWFTGRGADRLWAEKVARSYVKGYDIHVLYDPRNPGYSVMTRDLPRDARDNIANGIMMALFSFVWAGVYLWRLRPDRSAVGRG